MTIPRGRKVQIFSSGSLITGVPLILEEDVTISLSSSFAPLVDSGPASNLIGLLGNLSADTLGFGFSGQFKQAGFQVWKGTDPLQITFNVGLYMKTDALVDVIRPAKALMRIPLPLEGDDGNTGSFGLTPPGPSILEVFREGSGNTSAVSGKNISVVIGNTINLKKAIIKSVEPTFSSETDENDYPIWCKLKVDISSIYTATASMVDEYIGVDTR